MKKTLVILLVFMLLFYLVGCNSPTDNNGDDNPSIGGGETTQLKINDLLVFTNNKPGYVIPQFIDGAKAEKLTFTYDETKLTINPETMAVTGLVAGKHRVKATSDTYTAQFAVSVRDAVATFPHQNIPFFNNCLQSHWLSYWNEMLALYNLKGTNGQTTIFVGDSFFDEANFWTNFYEDYYAGRDALCMGIGSTTSATWEKLLEFYWEDIQPKNLVMHLGTNNIYNERREALDTIYDLQRMFQKMHDKMPNTQIYYFAITQRGYEENSLGQYATVDTVNATMKAWCESLDWITFMDTCDQLPATSLKDKIHPFLTEYKVFTLALASVGCEILDK